MNYLKLMTIIPLSIVLLSCNGKVKRKEGSFCNINFNGHNVKCNCPSYAPMDQDLQLKLDILYDERIDAKWASGQEPTKDKEGVLDYPNVEYTVSIDDIHVKIGGQECNDSFTFFYRNNVDNLLTIKKNYMINDVDIEIIARPRPFLFLYGYELGTELDKRWYDSKTSSLPYDQRDLFVSFSKQYQQTQKPIKTLSGQEAFPVFEHDDIEVTFEIDKNKDNNRMPLPDDLRFRCNARYTYQGIDYAREYSDPFVGKDKDGKSITGYRKCRFKVPHYIVNDHGSFRQFGMN